MRLLQAELLKATTTRLLLWFGLLILALAGFVVSTQIASTPDYELAGIGEQRSVVQFTGIAVLFSILLGIIVMANEYAHRTITHTFLATPTRERVMAAKLAAAALLGVLLGLFAAVVTVAIAELWFVAKGVHLSLGDRGVVLTLVGAVGASAIAGPLGVGVGGLLRRQTPAIVITLVWLLVGEGVVAVAGGARFAPGHAFAAVVSARGPHDDLLGAWSGVSVAAVYAAAFALGGTVAVVRRDVG